MQLFDAMLCICKAFRKCKILAIFECCVHRTNVFYLMVLAFLFMEKRGNLNF